jgi:prophage tail gpP-like protein
VTTEVITINVNGAPFTVWEAVTVHAGVKDAARSLQLTFPDTPGAPIWPGIFKGGPLVTVTTSPGSDAPGGSGGLLFTGYVDHCSPSFKSNEVRVTVTARAKGQDAVDSSVDHTKPDYVKKNVHDVAVDQDAFGIGFKIDFQPDGFDRWRPNVGHTLFACLAPLCEDENATMFGQADGSIKITRAGETAKMQGGPLVEGLNWHIAGNAEFTLSNQHSKIKAHGQNYKGNGASAIAILGEAENENIKRYRPLHEHHDRNTDKKKLTKRAQRRRDKEQGEGIRATAHVKTFRDDSGMLYEPGNKVFAYSPTLDLKQVMLIESVIYYQDGEPSSGTKCTLELVDPRAHGGKGGGVDNSGSEWSFGQ